MTFAEQRAREEEWYRAQGCQHAHCPLGCDKPQPFWVDGKMLCGRCHAYGRVVEVVPCLPTTCE